MRFIPSQDGTVEMRPEGKNTNNESSQDPEERGEAGT